MAIISEELFAQFQVFVLKEEILIVTKKNLLIVYKIPHVSTLCPIVSKFM